jgi:uncharacterized protein DUF1064
VTARKVQLGQLGRIKRKGRVRNVQSCVGADGFRYHSRGEARVAAELELRVKAGDIKDFERQVNFPLIVNGHKVCTYIADFLILHNDGTREVLEVKGWRTPEWILKEKLFRASWLHDNPGIRFTVREAR